MDSPVREGELFAGKYRVGSTIGVGGMGVVVVAEHLELNQRVALKFLKPDAVAKPELVERFLREARAATRINSEHVVRVLDVGRMDGGAPFLVMEYLEGSDLGALVDRWGAMPASEAVESVLHACEALAIAHSQGIIHRDIKPANLFMTRRPDGTPLIKLVDFGISKAALTGQFGEELSLTRSQSVVGSPLYMSPEAMQSARSIDARSDIWSLGVVLYELLSGELAFVGETITQVCIAVLQHEPRSLLAIKPTLPAELDQIVQHCLEKRPEDRYQTVADLAEGLLPFAPERTKVLVQRARAVTARTNCRSPIALARLTPAAATLPSAHEALAEARSTPHTLFSGAGLLSTPGAAQRGGDSRGVRGTARSAPPTERLVPFTTSIRAKLGWRGTILAILTLTMGFAAYLGARMTAPGRVGAAGSVPAPAAVISSSERSTMFTLHLESDPSGAVVQEGDNILGTTPVQMALDGAALQAAPRRLVLRRDGYLPHTVVQGPSRVDVRQYITLLQVGPDAGTDAQFVDTGAVPPAKPPRRSSPRARGTSKIAPEPEQTKATPVIRVER